MCGSCPPTTPTQALIVLDTSISGFTKSEIKEIQLIKTYKSGASDTSSIQRLTDDRVNGWDTLYLFDILRYSHLDSAVTSEFRFKSRRRITFQKIEFTDVTPPKNEKDCCEPCPTFKLKHIEIDSVIHDQNELPILILK